MSKTYLTCSNYILVASLEAELPVGNESNYRDIFFICVRSFATLASIDSCHLLKKESKLFLPCEKTILGKSTASYRTGLSLSI